MRRKGLGAISVGPEGEMLLSLCLRGREKSQSLCHSKKEFRTGQKKRGFTL